MGSTDGVKRSRGQEVIGRRIGMGRGEGWRILVGGKMDERDARKRRV